MFSPNPTPPSSLPDLVKRLRLLFVAMAGGTVIFLLVVVFLVQQEGGIADSLSEILIPVAIGTAVFIFALNRFAFRKLMAQIPPKSDKSLQLSQFQAAALLRMAMREGGTLFSVVMFLLTGNSWLLLLIVLQLGDLALLYPTLERATRELSENHEM